MNFQKTEGLVAAPFTPMNDDRSVAVDRIPEYANWLKQQGVVGAFVCGTTGESMSLSVEERLRVSEKWVQAASKDFRIFVHVGHTALGECQRLAAHAQSISAHSIACTAPFFFRPTSVENLVDWCVEVAAAAPKLPFYYYHIPSMTGVTIPVIDFLNAASDRIPNLRGVKFTFEDLDDFGKCLRFGEGKLDVLFGRDEILLSALKLGACGAVGSTYNFTAGLFNKLIEAFKSGDEARAVQLQKTASQMIDCLVKGGPSPIGTFKWWMNHSAFPCGPPRAPLTIPNSLQATDLSAKLASFKL
jgi:N-acetylneuraminate lyase